MDVHGNLPIITYIYIYIYTYIYTYIHIYVWLISEAFAHWHRCSIGLGKLFGSEQSSNGRKVPMKTNIADNTRTDSSPVDEASRYTLALCHGYNMTHQTYSHRSHSRPTWLFYSERPQGSGFRSVNPAERWLENPARDLARAGFSQHLECGIHRSESNPEGSFILIPHPVARWAKTTPW